jgi:hypothetical protein
MNNLDTIKIFEYSDCYSVYTKTGTKICDTASIVDAEMMISFDKTRFYKKNKVLVDQIVNIPYKKIEDDLQLKEQNILPDRQQDPFIV